MKKRIITIGIFVVIVLTFISIPAYLSYRTSVKEGYGTEIYFDKIMGLKSCPTEILTLQRVGGMLSLKGCNISEFDSSTANFFKQPPAEMFSLPVPQSYEKDKVFVTWRKTPVEDEYKELFSALIVLMGSIGLQGADQKAITNIANRSNGYYAISYEDHGDGKCCNVAFYLIDSLTRRFYYFTDTNTVFPHLRTTVCQPR